MRIILFLLFICTVGLAESLLSFANDLNADLNELHPFTTSSKKHELILRQTLSKIQNWNPNQYTQDEYEKKSEIALNSLFNLKLKLRENVTFAASQNESLISLYRKNLTALRYIEDQIAEKKNILTLVKKPSYKPFNNTVGFNQNKMGSEFSINDLQTGDILLIRGSSVTSSSIARISKAASTHSHLALVYTDELTNKSYLLEAMSHSGVIKTDLNVALSSPLARVSVYRHPDRELARKAANFANEQFTKASDQGELLKFDFSLDMTHNCRFFCSKFVSWVYQSESEDQVIIPKFQSSIARTNNAFKNKIGVKESILSSFLPSDIDLDPRFELINEYRNPEMTAQIRLDDLITDKIFEWIEKDNLDFKPNIFIKILSKIMLTAAKNKPIHSLLTRAGITLNPETPEELISTMAIMLYTVKAIKKEIYTQFETNYNLLGTSMTHKEVYELIETYKKKNPNLLNFFVAKKTNKSKSCQKFYL